MRKLLFYFSCVSFLYSNEEIHLKAPTLSRENIIGINVGIRPCRKSGVRIESEMLGEKFVIHNYGYGGSGLTLCLGGAREVMQLLGQRQGPVAVLGAGVAGLSVAYDLLNAGYEVRIYADAWENLTSNVAAGIWSPMVPPEGATEEKKQLIARMLLTAEKRLSTEEFAGVRSIDSYSFRSGETSGAIATKGRGEPVVVHFENGVTKTGKKICEIGIDGKQFYDGLKEKVTQMGASFITKYFSSVDELMQLEEPILINCTSMGSKELFNDMELFPIRGQIVYFQPEEGFDYLIYQNVPNETTTWVSIYPWEDRIIVGGVYEKGIAELTNDPQTIDRMIENAHKCLNGNL